MRQDRADGGQAHVDGVHHGFGDYARLPRRLFASLFRRRLMLLGVSNAVRDEKLKVIRALEPVSETEIVRGQYQAGPEFTAFLNSQEQQIGGLMRELGFIK